MGEVNFSIHGLREMERVMLQLGPKVASKVADKGLRAGAKPIVAEAKRLVPVRTGELRRSITVAPERRRKGAHERVLLIGFKRPTSALAHLVEFGTRFAAAQPFLRPALDSRSGEALREMGHEMARGLAQEALKLAGPVRSR